jgi:2'-5' RNA ligase
MRLFVAINPPDAIRTALHDAAAPLREAGMPVRWTAPASLHLTLKFLGETPQDRVEAIEAVLREAAAKTSPFDLPIGGIGGFPTMRRPRVIWIGAEATPSLRSLKQDVEWALASLGFEPEVRAFQPHVTIGRVTQGAQPGALRDLADLAAGIRVRSVFRVASVDLMRSRLTPRGARYDRIVAAPLGVPTGGSGERMRET